MKYSDFAWAIKAKTGLSLANCRLLTLAVFECVTEEVMKNGSVSIKGFGTFKKKTFAERKSVDPRTGAKIWAKERHSIRFTQVRKNNIVKRKSNNDL